MWLSLAMMLVTWAVLVSGAHAWWNEEWQYRKKVSLNTTGAGADIQQNLMEFPVLIRLHSGNFDFTRVKENGEDLRFVSGDDTTLLKYHIESFDSIDEIALVWVKVPALSGSAAQEAVWLYYGNENAVAGGDSKSSFDAVYQAVYHFNEFEGTPQDSASFAMHSTEYTGGLGLAGAIGNGATFSGAGNVMRVPENPAFNFSTGFTFSTWIKMYQSQEDAWLFSRRVGDVGLVLGIRGANVVVQVNDGDQFLVTDDAAELPLEGWHHLAITIAPKGEIAIYIDGSQVHTAHTEASLANITGDIRVGGDALGGHSFAGDLDEVRISGIARSPGWIRGIFASQGAGAQLCSYGIEEISEGGSGMPVFYLATIFKNITLDGLVVIGLLLLLAACSWVIMLSKGFFLWATARGDRQFLESYNQTQDPVAVDTGTKKINGSGIFRIYEAGCRSLNLQNTKVCENPDAPPEKALVSPKMIETLKATLEKGLIDESKRMNSWLVVLTMSISGGPFLGLLGTVWGVMNTFAAMAEAGEANIMAIAPGVASALSTTVFGLIVAIPALFGYSYLVSRIRDITADNTVFVDQFALRVDAVHGGES
ncbi:MAG: DUF2341 domain-containing protein [Desulfobacter sp.]|nr:MAG: DUF2341 domain-containing protein [Desulfobacter sp.]